MPYLESCPASRYVVSFKKDVDGTSGSRIATATKKYQAGLPAHAHGRTEVSGDVSPIHGFLGTDGVCGGGAVGTRSNQCGESNVLPSPRRHVVKWRWVLTSASVMMDDEQGGS